MSQPRHRFIAAGPAAQHCAELIPSAPDPAELAPRWQELGESLAKALAPKLATLLDGQVPKIEVTSEPAQLPGLTASALVSCEGIEGLLHLGMEGAAVLRLVDRAFGGPGGTLSPLPNDFPPSAKMLIERLEALVLKALSEACAVSTEKFNVRLRSQSMAALPLRSGASAALTLTVTEADRPAWSIGLTLPQAALPAWLTTTPHRRPRPEGAADPAAAPFADVPLPLTATLVDMRVPISTAASLAPGMVLPVAVARAVPLTVSGHVVARGTVGQQDDRIALKLTQIA
ncbi:MAG: hypothetical protein RL671_2322 [Pseudomonadota bacterium]